MMKTHETELLELLSLDDGPFDFTFKEISRKLLSKDVSFEKLLHPFEEALYFKSMELQSLLESYKSLDEKKKAMTLSVARWIHYTNQIEGVGESTVEDTQNVLGGCFENKESKGVREVLQMYDLLKETYNASPKVSDHILGVEKLKKWHTIMLKDIDTLPTGIFRTGLAFTDNKDGTIHRYPHNSIIKESLSELFLLTWKLAGFIDKNGNTEKRISQIFGLSSFLQYHFVDIHPFGDGNGRMCRFLSKYILDSLLPLPIPMFKDRMAYFNTLKNGRTKKIVLEAPVELALLLIDSAIDSYREIIEADKKSPLYFQISTNDVNEIKKMAHHYSLPRKMVDYLLESFENMISGTFLCLDDVKFAEYDGVRLHKQHKISWDDL